MSLHLEPDDVERFTAAAEAALADLMDSAATAFKAMAAAARHGERDGMAMSSVVVGDTCLQLCLIPAATWQEADSKVRFLGVMLPWAWPRHPALGAVLEAARRAESAAWEID